MSAPRLKIFIPLVPVRPDEKELVPLFASDNEKRMEKAAQKQVDYWEKRAAQGGNR